MSNQISGTAGAGGEKAKLSGVRLLATVALPAILGVALAWQITNRWLALQVEEGPDGNSMALVTPVNTFPNAFPLRKTQAGNGSLLQAIYRDSIPVEQTWLDWKGTVSPSADKRQLVVLTFQNRATLQQLESWYQKKLGANFSQTKAWPVAGGKEAPAWMRRVESHSQAEAITFHQELPHRARGVLILPGSAGQGSEIKLYDYMESPGQ
jgi:hypothetical protein